MSKKVWDGEYDINTDWGGDESTEFRPLPGSAVQDVIKSTLKKLDTGKVGYIAESDGTVYFSSSKEAYDNENYMGSVISTQRYSMDLQKDSDNKSVFLSSDTKKEFVWYFKTIEIATSSVYTETVTVEYRIKNETDGVDKLISTTINCDSDDKNDGFTKVVMNLDEYLTNGKSSIEIVVKGLRTKQERTLQQTITIVTLNIEDVTDFRKPFNDKLIVQTNINCTKGQDFYYEYRFNESEDFTFYKTAYTGEGRAVLNTYNIDISSLSEGRHIFEYRLFINIGGESIYRTSTQRIEFIKGAEYVFEEPQILIFSSYFDNEIAKADDGNLIINGASQYVPFQIKYAVHNNEASTTNVEFYDITTSEDVIPITITVDRGVFAYYSIQSMNHGEKTIKIICKDIDGNIINEEGRKFYIDIQSSTLNISEYKTNLRTNFSSVGKSNESQDKNTWISNISENGFLNTATFSETFDWSQGWTKNGLVISDGCEVIFDYAPFPQQKTDSTVEESNEYVGGDKAFTFEIEFMTQNVTDENAVLCDMTNELSTNDCGLLITGSEIKFTTPGGESVSSRFKEGDMNRVAIVIHPEKTSGGDFKGLVELYINGIMSSIAKYNYTDKFEVFERDENGNALSKRLRFKGNDGADLVVKYIRTYNGAMSPDDVVNNYIIYREDANEMLTLYNKNNIINDQGVITPDSVIKLGNIPIIIFVGRTVESELASGDGNKNGYDGDPEVYPDGYIPGSINANETNWYATLEQTTDKKKNIDMDVIYYNPLDKSKNFKFVKAYITPQGTSSMYYPKKNYRIYTQKNEDTRMFLSQKDNVLELDQMLTPNFGENPEDRVYEVYRGTKNKKKRVYSFKDNAQAVKCWCLKADFAETSSSHNTGIARLWGDTLKNSTVTISNKEYNVFKTNAQATIEQKYNNNVNGDMPDIRTTIDGFPIVVFGKKSYADEYVFLGKYNFNNDKSTESVFGFCDIDDKVIITDDAYDYENDIKGTSAHTLDGQLDQYMTCVETLDNGNALANFSTLDNFDSKWEDAFEFRYPEIPEEPDEKDYQDDKGNWTDKEGYDADLKEFEEETLPYWENTHLKPFKHFAEWLYSTRWCDVNGNILEGLTEDEAMRRKEKFAKEKWDHIDVWKMSAYYIYTQRFGAVDQIVKNSMLTSEGPFAYDKNGIKYGEWDNTDVKSPLYGRYYKWYYINYDNDTIMGVKNDGSLRYGPEITRQDMEGEDTNKTPIYAGYTSTLWNNIEYDEEFQDIIKIADRGISKTMTYSKAINTFEVEQVGKWCERIYNKDAEYKYISPYMADWKYTGDDENAESFVDKLFMLQGSRTAHRRWWLSRRFNLLDGRWSSGDFAAKYVEVKCDYGSIGDKFTAIAGANAYFGYQINNRTFGDAKGGVTQEYKANEQIDWELRKVINIGDPIAIYGSNDLLELNLQCISKNLSSVSFRFGTNVDLGNKLERLILSIDENDLLSNSSYKAYVDDEVGTVNGKTSFEKLKFDYPFEITGSNDAPIVIVDGIETNMFTSEVELNANESGSPKFYRIISVNDEGDEIFTYFVKLDGGIRNYACKGVSFDALDKLQILKMAGYMSVNSLDLSKNKFINELDVRYSSVSTVNFGEGSRIRSFKASNKLTLLELTNCDNLTLSNIFINSSSLKNDGGKNINIININNSTGLNHSNDFKDFVIKWMESGDVSAKKLNLRGVKWNNVKISDLDTIREFLLGDEYGKKALECVITGVIEMGPEKITSDDLTMFNNLVKALGGSLTIRIPYANILLNRVKTEIVAGESAEYTYTLFPDAETIINGGGVVEYFFVVEVSEDDDFDVKDSRTNRYYRIIEDTNEVREGVRISKGNKDNEIIVTTTENVVGGDTNTLVMASLSYEGETKFDIAPLLIKEPTYAVNGSINGFKNIGNKNTTYTYTLSIISNTNEEPIGSVDIEWSITGENVGIYLSGYEVSDDKRTFTITTSDIQPDPTSNLLITAKVKNHEASKLVIPPIPSVVTIEKPLLLLNENVVLTIETNPVVFTKCREMGWAANEIVMTRAEAEAVEDLRDVFANIKSEKGWAFEEFIYFTNANLTSLTDGAFANSDITSIVFPQNVTIIGKGAFEGCSKLKDVQLTERISEISERCFLNCVNLVNFVLPDNVEYIQKFAFGGTNIEKISDKANPFIEGNKAILVSENSKLMFIENDAFETEVWSIETTTNKLSDILLPKKLRLREASYNFTLGKELTKITIMSEEETFLAFKDNMLYANDTQNTLVRALPKATTTNVLDIALAEYVTTVYPYAFYNCDTIKMVIFGGSMFEYGLGKGAFFNSSIEVVDLSRCLGMEALQEETFKECKKLKEVIFPMDGKLTKLGPNLFYNCTELSAITLSNTITEFEGNNTGDSNTFVKCNIEELVLPNSLVKSGRFFVNECKKLKRIVFSDFFTSVGSGGSGKILNCASLEEVILPIFSYTDDEGNDVIVNSYLENNTTPFENCPNIQRYILNAKDNNKLFIESNNIIYRVGNIDDGVIKQQGKELHAVPFGISALTIDEGTITIGAYSMCDCDKLTNVVIPEGVKTIKRKAFVKENSSSDSSSSVRNVTLPKSLEVIEEYAFDWCQQLRKIVVPEGVTKINNSVFRWCTNLTEVIILGNITQIGRFAFNYCKKLEKIVLLAKNAPALNHGEYVSSGDTYQYHPFGYNNSTYTGYETKLENNILYLPYGYKGYDAQDWVNPLQYENRCKFILKEYPLDQEVFITAIGVDGNVITDEMLYFESESGDFVFKADNTIKSATYNVGKGSYELLFDGNVYHGEKINVYTDIEKTNKIGTFEALYGVDTYEVGGVVLSYTSRNLFATNLFGTTSKEVSKVEEPVQITKSEYERLISRINQLTEIINKLK
jgi:hypothetical protein